MTDYTPGLCVIGRAEPMGLGTMTEEFCKAMRPERLIVIDRGRCVDYSGWANQVITVSWTRPEHGLAKSLVGLVDGMKTVVGFETWYWDGLPQAARGMGVKTVMFPMWEWSPESVYGSDVVVSLCGTDYGHGVRTATRRETKPLLTDWPASTTVHDPARVINWPPKRFVHFAGNAKHNRDGTREVLAAAEYLKGTGATLVVYAQFDPRSVGWSYDPEAPIEFRGRVEDRRDLLAGADCVVCPRRLPGHSLPINEAVGEGIPVVVLDLSDWPADRFPYRVSAQGGGHERGFGPHPQYVWNAEPNELGRTLRALAECHVVKVPQWRPPTWDQFRQWWEENI